MGKEFLPLHGAKSVAYGRTETVYTNIGLMFNCCPADDLQTATVAAFHAFLAEFRTWYWSRHGDPHHGT